MPQIEIKELADSFRTLASASELVGQERALVAVLEHLEVRGAEKDELAIFEKAVRERLEYSK